MHCFQYEILKSVCFALDYLSGFSDKESVVFTLGVSLKVAIVNFSHFKIFNGKCTSSLWKVDKIPGEKRDLWENKVAIYY